MASAWGAFKEAERIAGAARDADRLGEAGRRAKAIEGQLSRLTITVGAAERLPGLTVKRNNAEIGEGQWGSALPVDAGEHVLEVSAPGHRSWLTSVPVPPNGATISVAIPRLIADPVLVAPPEEPRSWWTGQRIAGASVGGVGVVGLVVGAIFGAQTLSKIKASKEQCSPSDPNFCNDVGVALRSDAKTAGTASTAALVAGSVLVVGGAVLVLTAPAAKAPEEKAREAVRLELRPLVGAAEAGLVLGAGGDDDDDATDVRRRSAAGDGAGAGCLQMAGYEDARPGWTGASATTSGSTGTTTSSSTGGMVEPCANGVRDGNETGVDCGGGSCPACGEGEGCTFGSDCTSLVCASGGACAAPACDDGIKNGDESDKDCGGSCAGCEIGEACVHSTDCANNATCKGSKCADPFVWAKRYGDASDQVANGIAVTRGGGQYVALVGSFAGAIDFGDGAALSGGGDDVFLSYLRTDSAAFKTLRFGGANSQHGTGIAIGVANNARFTGDFLGSINVGKTYANSGASPAAFVASVDISGGTHGSKAYYAGVEPRIAIAADSMDNVLLTGGFSGAVDFGGGALTSQGAATSSW
ncbi:Tryptophan synthase alpha chain [Minicystis rosea]|nr:Tryptophan synthase alpha chain [Minicystis rosea]